MPVNKAQVKRKFESSKTAYINAIDASKVALVAAVDNPNDETDAEYMKAARNEKEARKAYRKATKKLHALA